MAALAESLQFEQLSLAGLPMPVTLRPAAPLSDKELIAFSRRNRPYRIEQNAEGELEITTPLNTKGGHREMFVGSRLFEWAELHGGLVVSSSAGFTLADHSVRSPDASWVSDARWNALTDAQQRGFAPVCPEFLVEILSESDSRPELEEKMEMQISNGAELARLIDPFAADVIIYRPGKKSERLMRPDWVESDAVVPGFRLETSRLWAKQLWHKQPRRLALRPSFVDNRKVERGLTAPPPLQSGIRVAGTPSLRRGVSSDLLLID